jgi:hypothetical protein
MGSRATSVTLFLFVLAAFARADDAPGPVTTTVSTLVMTTEDAANVGVGTASVPGGYVNKQDPWLDRVHQDVFNAVWRSAMRMDRMFGGSTDEAAYMETTGSIAPALLYDQFDGFQPRVRFQVDVPLPQINERFHAFIGRVNPDEYVTERRPGSGAFARQYGGLAEEDETLFGIRYRDPKDGGHWDADAGLRIRSPLDPFIKGSYRFDKGSSERTLVSFRETVFWQNTEKLGFTSRVDVERILREVYLLRWTTSATISERSDGVKGYMSLIAMRGLPNRRAVAAELFSEGEMDADVPLGNYGLKLAYRRSIMRDWLILETRVSLTYPKDLPTQPRAPIWGVGVGLEMFFGTGEFLARPVTF